MHALVVRVTIKDRESAQRGLNENVVPGVSQAPGFRAGYWTWKDNGGLSMIVFDSEDARTRRAIDRNDGPGHRRGRARGCGSARSRRTCLIRRHVERRGPSTAQEFGTSASSLPSSRCGQATRSPAWRSSSPALGSTSWSRSQRGVAAGPYPWVVAAESGSSSLRSRRRVRLALLRARIVGVPLQRSVGGGRRAPGSGVEAQPSLAGKHAQACDAWGGVAEG